MSYTTVILDMCRAYELLRIQGMEAELVVKQHMFE